MKYTLIVLILSAFFSCQECPECPNQNCNDLITTFNDLKSRYDTLVVKYSNLLQHCQELGIPYDTCDYPDTFQIYTDTIPIEIYQNCFFCVRDSFKINDLFTGYIGYDNDTFIIAVDTIQRYLYFTRYRVLYKDTTIYQYSNQYYKVPVENIDYTDIFIYGFSHGVHHGQHDYEFAGTHVKINGTDSLIKWGKLIYYDLPERAIDKAYYIVRVLQPLSSIESIELDYFNDQSSVYTDPQGNQINEDMNLYLTGIQVGGLNLFNPSHIPQNNNYGWTNNDQMYILVTKGVIVVETNF
ncbi:MAG: hypothetical protein PHW73_00450 [Atribacterota bacterium]|nr:hypothetical protein [Atribacterota bacterium]